MNVGTMAFLAGRLAVLGAAIFSSTSGSIEGEPERFWVVAYAALESFSLCLLLWRESVERENKRRAVRGEETLFENDPASEILRTRFSVCAQIVVVIWLSLGVAFACVVAVSRSRRGLTIHDDVFVELVAAAAGVWIAGSLLSCRFAS